MPDDHDQGDEIKGIDGVFGLSAMKGIAFSSENGPLSFVGAGKDSSIILDTKNFALLKAGENCVALYDSGDDGGLVNIQGHHKGALNLSIQDENVRNTALTITEGKAHLGVFSTSKFDRVHVEQGKVTLQSGLGTIDVPTDLSSLTITPSSIVIQNRTSVLTVEQDGFNLKNAAKTFELKMNSTEFSVTGQKGNLFKIDLTEQKITFKGLQIEVEAQMEVRLQALENNISLNAATLKQQVVTLDGNYQALQREQVALRQMVTEGLQALKAGLNNQAP
jgi:hypothetical protein